MTDRRPTSAAGGARNGLTTEQVLATALQILDTEGPQALSMRRLAHALDREAMAIYRHAGSKDALLDGIVELVLSELTINPAADDWQAELRRLAEQFRRLALAHPHVVPLIVTRPLATPLGLRPPGTLRPLENFLELLIQAGFSPADALHAYRLYFGFLHGHVLDELQELVDDPDEADDLLRLGLHRLSRRKFPQIRGLAHELATYDGATQLQQGVDMMINGLAAHFPAAGAEPTPSAERNLTTLGGATPQRAEAPHASTPSLIPGDVSPP